ncbi:hypothetical protein AVEN_200511-1 [Araneus ventricosus]|uniref:Uncharacterized protein n=1 Tax=Araneus ventricosus TaxID=182803 RepID=A0A4Y2FYC0_ARAVE|nr:hypothetical protein AVEN_200511-1 [Araneus ventricosus]
MGPCDDLPAKPELLHWGTMRRARRDLVTRLCRASVNSAIKEHGVMCRLTATAFDENDPSVRTLCHAESKSGNPPVWGSRRWVGVSLGTFSNKVYQNKLCNIRDCLA